MPSTILGKRSRTSVDFEVMIEKTSTVPESNSRESRAKRRAVVKDDKENSIPFRGQVAKGPPTISATTTTTTKIYDDGCFENMDIDIKSPAKTPSKSQPSRATLALSPAKINGHFKSSKATDENQQPPQKQKVTIASPSTPRHRGRIISKPLTPRHRIGLPGSLPRTPKTPGGRTSSGLFHTPTTPSSRTIFTAGKNLFARSTAPDKLIGRETERKKLMDFIGTRIVKKTGGCLYVSGPPGTGKSALLTDVLKKAEEGLEGVRKAYVNCMTMKDPQGIYTKLVEEFLPDIDLESSDSMADLKKLFTPSKKNTGSEVFVVVLDEIDHLVTRDQDVLYKIFEWSLVRQSKLLLIGIANALDLTDRFLPRLKARNFSPTLLPVLPYTADQIVQVVTSRLKSLVEDPSTLADPNWIPLIHPAAITLCAKKVATSTGDLRKCFDICKKAIELVEDETRIKMLAEQEKEAEGKDVFMGSPTASPSRKPLGENHMNMCSPSATAPNPLFRSNPLTTFTAATAPRATLAHIARISSTSFGFTSSSRLKLLNLQQKAVLCALTILATSTTVKSVTVKTVWEMYKNLCSQEKVLSAVSRPEFADIVSSLEGAGVVEVEKEVKSSLAISTPSKRGKLATGNEDRSIRATITTEELKASLAGDGGEILMRFFVKA